MQAREEARRTQLSLVQVRRNRWFASDRLHLQSPRYNNTACTVILREETLGLAVLRVAEVVVLDRPLEDAVGCGGGASASHFHVTVAELASIQVGQASIRVKEPQRTGSEGDDKVDGLLAEAADAVVEVVAESTTHGSLAERRDNCDADPSESRSASGTGEGVTEAKKNAPYCEMPFCVGPPMSPHHPMYLLPVGMPE